MTNGKISLLLCKHPQSSIEIQSRVIEVSYVVIDNFWRIHTCDLVAHINKKHLLCKNVNGRRDYVVRIINSFKGCGTLVIEVKFHSIQRAEERRQGVLYCDLISGIYSSF